MNEKMNWEYAKEKLIEYKELYSEIPTGGFGLSIISNLLDRYNNGERSKELYDDILSIE